MPYNLPPDPLEILITLAISLASGAISIGRRIVSGEKSNALWIFTEFATAVLCGTLMYSMYPHIQAWLPSSITLPVAVALAAHSGGRLFQESESFIITKMEKLLSVFGR